MALSASAISRIQQDLRQNSSQNNRALIKRGTELAVGRENSGNVRAPVTVCSAGGVLMWRKNKFANLET